MAAGLYLIAMDNRQRVFLWSVLLFFAGFYWLDGERLHKTIFYLLIPVSLFCFMRGQFWMAFIRSRIVWCLLAYISYQLMSLSWSAVFNGEEAGEIIRKGALSLFFVAVVASVVLARPHEKLWFWPIILLATGAALYSSLGFVFAEQPPERMTGIGRGRNPIQTAALYGSAFIAAGYGLIISVKNCSLHVFSEKKKVQLQLLFWAICWVILFIAMVLTESRAAMLAAIGAQFAIMLRLMPIKWAITLLLAFVMVLMVVATQLVDLQHWLQRADSFRFEIWQQIFSKVQTQGAWLHGLGYRTPFEITLSNGQTVFQPHSLYVSALYYGGFIGLVVLLVLFFMVGWELFIAKQEGVLFLALWLNSLVFALVDYNLLLVNNDTEWLLFWLPIGGVAAIAMQRIDNHNIVQTQEK